MNDYYLKRFKLQVEPDHLFRHIDIDKFFIAIKGEFFNLMSSKWSTGLFKRFVTQNNLDVKICYSILKKFNEIYFQRNQKGSKGFNKFLLAISKIRGQSFSKIGIKTNNPFFLEELQKFREVHFSNISNEAFIQFVDENFTTGYTKTSLRRLLYEEGIFKKTSRK